MKGGWRGGGGIACRIVVVERVAAYRRYVSVTACLPSIYRTLNYKSCLIILARRGCQRTPHDALSLSVVAHFCPTAVKR